MLKDIDVSAGKVKDGAYSARARITALFDRGTFSEVGAYINRSRSSNPDEFSGVICGYGAIDGKLVFAFAEDSSRMGGVIDERHAKKIADLYKLGAGDDNAVFVDNAYNALNGILHLMYYSLEQSV